MSTNIRQEIINVLSHVPPYAAEAEMAVLGSMMMDRRALEYACDELEEKFFYQHPNPILFRTMLELFKNGSAVDFTILSEDLRSKKLREEVGGSEYLNDCLSATTTAVHIEEYCKLVKEAALARFILDGTIKLVGLLQEKEFGAGIEALDALARAVEDRKAGGVESATAKEVAHPFLEDLERRRTEKEPELMTGFTKLDQSLWGIKRGEVITVGARTGRGKSTFLLNIAMALLRKRKKVLYFSTEMSKFDKWNRLASMLTGIFASKFRQSDFTPEEWDKISKVVEWLYGNDDFVICDVVSPTISQVRSLIRKHRPAVVMLDYLGLFSFPKEDRKDLQIGEFMKQVKGIARGENVAILVASQLNRNIDLRDNKIPTLADLKESGSIEQESDIVILLYDEAQSIPMDYRVIYAKIEKNRHGELGQVKLHFDPRNLRISEPQFQ